MSHVESYRVGRLTGLELAKEMILKGFSEEAQLRLLELFIADMKEGLEDEL